MFAGVCFEKLLTIIVTFQCIRICWYTSKMLKMPTTQFPSYIRDMETTKHPLLTNMQQMAIVRGKMVKKWRHGELIKTELPWKKK